MTPSHDDIDNPKGFLRISAEQKNKEESRVPINPTAGEILSRCQGRMALAPKRKTLWRWTDVSHMGNLFKKAVRAAGYEEYRFHDLRHTFASYMAMQGEPLKTIQDLMRHKSITSTLVYAHLSPEHLVEASNRFVLGPLPTSKPEPDSK
ncbi:site-specific integrase [Desulfoluna sp.]|uniref:tyrosine-type recombinase/integrase n=1 Tax=Desulfoluna sp. TaxID=2045199 RepID=UPI0026212734|nr:site-specific integrase [Desulfoluna sp.]